MDEEDNYEPESTEEDSEGPFLREKPMQPEKREPVKTVFKRQERPSEDAFRREPAEKKFEKPAEKKVEEKRFEKEEDELKVSGTTVWQIISAVLAILLVISIFTYGFRFGREPTARVVETELPEEEPAPTARAEVSADDDPVKGPNSAKVTIIEFSDFQCPFCGRAQATLNQIQDTYGDDVKFVFRDFPLGFHENAQKSAEAAECAHEQGKFWEYHDLLFENQEALAVTDLKGYAAELDLDTKQFNECLDSGKYEEEVKSDMDDGIAAGVKGTPAFFINGRSIVGAQPFANFKKVIDEELE